MVLFRLTRLTPFILLLVLGVTVAASVAGATPVKDAAPAAAADVVVFTNGDRLSGKLVRAVSDTVTFHSDLVGDVTVPWTKVKELHTAGNFAVLEKGVVPKRKLGEGQVSIGEIRVEDQRIHFTGTAAATNHIPSIATGRAAYVVDQASLDKQLLQEPGFFEAWNGSATAGVTLVKATENQYTVTSAVGLARIVPTVAWLPPRNRTTANFNSSFGKITSPAYTDATGTFVPETITKSNILHGDGERDQYFSPRFYYLFDLSFDHNYAQSLDLQQVYGAGIGYTVLKRPKQELDVKAVAQYDSQRFLDAMAGADQNLIGATFSANYLLTLRRGITLTQQASFLPAFNNPRAYSATETDALNLPVYKNFSFTMGSLDSYLNDTPLTVPVSRRNSFQFTIGATYSIKSKY